MAKLISGKVKSSKLTDTFIKLEEVEPSLGIPTDSNSIAVSDIDVEHIGSVSTSQTIKKDRQIFFENWCISSNIFIGTDENKP